MKDLEKEFPSIPLAYELAMRSYDQMQKNRGSLNSLFMRLMSFAVPLTLAIPVLSKALGLTIEKGWWVAIALLFLGAMICYLCGRLRHPQPLIDPGLVYERDLHKPQIEFQKDYIYWVAEDFKAGRKALDAKWRWCVVASVILCLEVLTVIFWAAMETRAQVVV